MEIQTKSKEEIIELLAQYEEKENRLAKKRKWIAALITICILILFLYLRLFNTVYKRNWYTGEIMVDYSTAWVIRIPSDVNENPKEGEVERITIINNAFTYPSVKCPNVKYIYIDDGIEAIGYPHSDYSSVGFGKTGLRAIRLPETLSYIGHEAFFGCVDLKDVYWEKAPENTVIGIWAFAGTGLKQIEIPEGVSTIDGLAFCYNDKLERVTLPQSLTQMNAGAFADCKNLKEIVLPDSLDSLPDCAFSGCKNLQQVTFPKDIVFMGRHAFLETQIDKEQYPENLFFYTYATSLVNDRNITEYVNINDGLHSTITNSVDVYDIESENVYLSEKTGIPVEVFAEPADSDRVWIEGQYYTFPMFLEDFLTKDNWKDKEIERYYTSEHVYEHVDSGRKIIVITDWEDESIVRGITVYDKYDCHVVLPGGITNQGTHYYRVNEMLGLNNNIYYDPWWEYVAGSEEHPMKVSISFVGEYDSRIDSVEIYASKENP